MGERSYLLGKKGEEKGVKWLEKNGFVVIERNFHSKFGEIDIVAKKEGVIHFIEVKFSKKYDPIYAITPQKMGKILKAIQYYCLKREVYSPLQVDALIIQDEACRLIENISM
jgi:putative endonuclease